MVLNLIWHVVIGVELFCSICSL